MIGQNFYQFHDLQEACRPGEKPRLSTVVRWLTDMGVSFKYDGNGGVWTTQKALDAALGIQAANDSEPYDAAELFGRK